MKLRIGTVTNIYPDEGKVKVMYEDEDCVSLPLPMLTMNEEYMMPKVGERVLSLHMANGSSKGFVLGTYYGGIKHPLANKGYRKDLGEGVTILAGDGKYHLKASDVVIEADTVSLECKYGVISVSDLIKRLERIEDTLDLPHTV